MFGKRGDNVGLASGPAGSDFLEKKVDALQEKILTAEKLQSQVFDFMAEFEQRVEDIVKKKVGELSTQAASGKSPEELKEEIEGIVKEAVSGLKTGADEESINRKFDDLQAEAESKLDKAISKLNEQVDASKNELTDLKNSLEGLSQEGASKEIGELRDKLQEIINEARQVIDSAKRDSGKLAPSINLDQVKVDISSKFEKTIEQLKQQIQSNNDGISKLKDAINQKTPDEAKSEKLDDLSRAVQHLTEQVEASKEGSIKELDTKITEIRDEFQNALRDVNKAIKETSEAKYSKALELLKRQIEATDERMDKLRESLKALPKPDPKLSEFKSKMEEIAKETKATLAEIRKSPQGKLVADVKAKLRELEGELRANIGEKTDGLRKGVTDSLKTQNEKLAAMEKWIDASKSEFEAQASEKLAAVINKLDGQIKEGLAKLQMPDAVADELKRRLEEEISQAVISGVKTKDLEEFEMRLMGKINKAMDLMNRQVERHGMSITDLMEHLGSLTQSEIRTEGQVAPALNDLKSYKLTVDHKFNDVMAQLDTISSGLATHDYVAMLETEFRKKLARLNSRLNSFEVEGFGGAKQPMLSREALDLRNQLKGEMDRMQEVARGINEVKGLRNEFNRMGAELIKIREDFNNLSNRAVMPDQIGPLKDHVNELSNRLDNLLKTHRDNRKLVEDLTALKTEVFEVAGSSVKLEQLEQIKKFLRDFNAKGDALSISIAKLDEKIAAVASEQKKVGNGRDMESINSRLSQLDARTLQVEELKKHFNSGESTKLRREMEAMRVELDLLGRDALRASQIEDLKKEFSANVKPAKQKDEIEAIKLQLNELSKNAVMVGQLEPIKKNLQDFNSKADSLAKALQVISKSPVVDARIELAKQRKDIESMRQAMLQLNSESVKVGQLESIKKYLTDFNSRAEEFSKNLGRISKDVGRGTSKTIVDEISRQRKDIEALKAGLGSSQIFTDELKGLALRLSQVQEAVKQLKKPDDKHGEMEVVKRAVKRIADETEAMKAQWTQDRERLFDEMKGFAKGITAKVEELEVSKPDKTGFAHVRKSVEKLVGEIEAFELRADEERLGLMSQLSMFKEFTEKTNRRVDELSLQMKKASESKDETIDLVKRNFVELNSQLISFKGYSLEQIGKINEWIGFIKENLK